MSPIDTSELERRLSAGLDTRSRQASVPSAADGRAAIADRVVRRRRHRRTVQAVTAVLVVVALVAAGLGLSRHHQEGQQVVTGVHQQVPPLPQLGLPASVGQTKVTFLYPGNGVIEQLSHLPQFSDTLSVVVSDQSLDELRQQRSGPGVSVASASVGGRPAFTVTPEATPDAQATDPSGVYWKPDAHHTAALAPQGQSVVQALGLAGHVVQLSDSAWWAVTGGAPSGYDSTRSSTGATMPARRGHSLDDPAARLGLPGGRTTAMSLTGVEQRLESALDVPGFAPGSFSLTTNFDVPLTGPLGKAGDKDSVAVRGTVGTVQDMGRSIFVPTHQHTLNWLEGGEAFQLRYGPPVRWDGQRPSSTGPVPTLADARRVAARLRVLSVETWMRLLSPDSLRLDLTTPGVVPCIIPGACAVTPPAAPSSTSTTGH